jgi:puromycin-sensitive aminopeptidase
MPTVTRLLDAIRPSTYSLTIEPDLTKFTFVATEEIEFELLKASHRLTFHAVGLDIMVATIDGQQAAENPIIDNEAQTVSFNFAEELPTGSHTLRLQFHGIIAEGLHGFYRSSYEYEGKEHWLATTQFEAVHAREAFVCIDEPSAKSVFSLNLVVAEHLTALANTNIIDERVEDGRKHLKYAPTPKMSTYLVAYIIGELEYVEATSKEGVLVRAYATPGKRRQLDFAVDTATKILSFYHDYFDIAYPLPKLDMVAIPDFGAGAMENWGLVTYREAVLLLDPKQSSLGNRQRVTEVIAHELAHQWFGNLVTMAWWNDLWLNEGFASWIEVLAQDKLFPEWQIWTQFVTGDIAGAMELDALATTHAIEVEVDDPRQLDEIFDAISYAKGASIIHMISNYLGEDNFRDGLRIYLKRHAYSNTVTADLWKALSETSNQPVDKVVGPWTSQPGFPIISIEDGKVSQRRFFASPTEAKLDGTNLIWPVPLTILSDDGKVASRLLKEETEPADELATAVKLNPGQSGFYRHRYGLAEIKQLTPLLAKATLPAPDRYGIVADVYAAAGAGLTESVTALTLTEALYQEHDYAVWLAISGGFGELLGLIPDGDLYAKAEAFGLWLVQANLKRLGWTVAKDEPYFDTIMRSLILRQAIRFDDPKTIKEARQQFQAHLDGSAPINPDHRPAVYSAIARNGGSKDYETLSDLYHKETVTQEKLRLLSSLSGFKQPELTARTLTMGMNPKEVRPQDTVWTISGGMANRYSRLQTWQFIQDHWDILVKRYGSGGHMLDHFVGAIGATLTTHKEAEAVKTFFAAHPHPAITRPVAQAVEAVTQRADWFERDETAITDFFEDWKP